MMDSSKTIVVTGGTSGIGRAAALGFAKAGWRVATCGRRADRLAEIVDLGVELAMPADVSNPADVEALFGAAVVALTRFGGHRVSYAALSLSSKSAGLQ